MRGHEHHSLSREFRELKDLCSQGDLNLQAILDHVNGRGQALVTLFLAGPFLLPLPMPGLSIPFGILIILFGLSLCLGFKVKLPRRWQQKRVPRELLIKFSDAAIQFLKRTERWIRPRYPWLGQAPLFRILAGAMITLAGVLLALPLPPGTNAPPAFSIVCLSIALLEGDGLLMVLGYVLFTLNCLFFAAMASLGYEAILQALGFLSL